MASGFIKIETLHYVRQFEDGGVCFIILKSMSFGVVPFYSSAEVYAATNGYGEGDYHELVERSVPATPVQIVGELEAYAEAIGASQHEPADWPPSRIAWPYRSWCGSSGSWPRVYLADGRTGITFAAYAGYQAGCLEMHVLARALAEVRGAPGRAS